MENQLIKAANNLIRQGRFADAIEILERLEDEEPENPEIKFNIAIANMEMWNIKEAIKNFERINTLNEDFSEHLPYMARAFMATNDFIKGIYFGKLYLDKNFSEESSEIKNTISDLAICYFKVWEHEKAKNNLKKLIEMWESYPEIYELLWKCYFKINKNEKSLFHLNKAIYLGSEKAELWNMKAAIYAQNKNYKDAIFAISKAITKNTNNVWLYYNKAYYEFLDNDLTTALKTARYAEKLEPSFPHIYIVKALLFIKQKKVSQAEKEIESAIKLDKNIPQIYVIQAQINIEKNELEKAKKNIDTAKKLWEDELIILKLTWKYFEAKNKPKNATINYEKALDIAIERWLKAEAVDISMIIKKLIS